MRPHTPPSVPLADLARRFRLEGDPGAVIVSGISMASTDVQPGDLYLGVPGANAHGADFAADAVSRGAAAIVTDANGVQKAASAGVPVLRSGDSPRLIAGDLAAAIYGTGDDNGDGSTPLTLGITGTNGKTSTAHMLDALLKQLGKTTGLSSTAERRVGDEAVTSHLTTPEATELHALLARMREVRVDAVIIEVSAHALSRHRVDGVMFDVAAFTNLSHDHLDDYASMDEYLEAKIGLFTSLRAKRAVVSLDSPAGFDVVARSQVPVATIATVDPHSHTVPDADWLLSVDAERPDYTEFTLTHTTNGSVTTRVPLIGRHMASNAGLAIAMLVEGGIALHDLSNVLASDGRILVDLPGRLVRVSGVRGPTLYVDSGHTPDAFSKSLAAVRAVTSGRVIMVTGADGGRDATKRHDMGREAMRGSDLLILTDHHVRFEDPAGIRRALREGAHDENPEGDVREIGDPREAIRAAVASAAEGDTILWAGLASQDYRDVRGVEQPFDAALESRRALIEAGW
ncbi:UDP-N-acetylmuramoyl-L-alanyl-D-glutamate--2,6-diaminopimelate ligase [Okibacterium endophyticum]